MRLPVFSLFVPLAFLALTTPTQAAGKLPISGVAPLKTKATLEGQFSLLAHPPESNKGSKDVVLGAAEGHGQSFISMALGEKEKHGTYSSHAAGVRWEADKVQTTWELLANAVIVPNCPKGAKDCGEVTASTTAKLSYDGIQRGELTKTVTVREKTGEIMPQKADKKDPRIALYLDNQEFFSVDIFATESLSTGLDPTLHADFSFGTLTPGYDLTLFYGGFSCGLSTCSSNPSFMNSLQSIISTGPTGNWEFDPIANRFINKNDITLPSLIYENPNSLSNLASFGASAEGSSPGVERVPTPLPILGVGLSGALVKRLKISSRQLKRRV